MARFKAEWDPTEAKMVKTLTFMDKEYREIWKEKKGVLSCACGIEKSVDRDYPDLPDEVKEAVEKLLDGNEYEVMDNLSILGEYEQSGLKG